MKLPFIAVLVSLCLVLVSLSGCISDTVPATYFSHESLVVDIYTNFTGNFSVIVPTLFVNQTSTVSPVWRTLKPMTLSISDILWFAGLNATDKGTLERVDAGGPVMLVGEYDLNETSCCSRTEAFTYNRWAPTGTSELTVPARATTVPPQSHTTEFVYIDIQYTGRSDHCARHDHISGDIPLDGSWSMLNAQNLGASCS